MKGTFKIFANRELMMKTINKTFDKDDFQMTKRNTPYGKFIGYIDDAGELVGFASIVMDGDKMHIHTFEISEYWQRSGEGTDFYRDLVEFYEPSEITLDPLDDNAEAFWERLGFWWYEVEPGDKLMIKVF